VVQKMIFQCQNNDICFLKKFQQTRTSASAHTLIRFRNRLFKKSSSFTLIKFFKCMKYFFLILKSSLSSSKSCFFPIQMRSHLFLFNDRVLRPNNAINFGDVALRESKTLILFSIFIFVLINFLIDSVAVALMPHRKFN
jgi:hypothetical protein